MDIAQEVSKRRTFAIVSHPDAGKTTLTEKFLLYGGAVNLAGSVTARKKERATVSDWLEIEKKRGISVSSTVLYFDYNDFKINLLDTPGHNDFSEDTYRVLTAVDSVIMVIDGGKGIENQTKKLFEVCRKRHIPVITFVNKMDRPALDTLTLLDEIENALQIKTYPVNLPLGSGIDFKGVWDRRNKLAYLYERTVKGAYRAPVSTIGLDDPVLTESLSESVYSAFCEDLEMLDQAGTIFNMEEVLNGTTTPVFFGSAANNFGIQILLDGYLEFSMPPQPRMSADKRIAPEDENFSGFIFKIQANMDPKHRDRMAFIRVVSGKFTKDMHVVHTRTGKKLRLSNTSNVFGRDRASVDEAYAGDVIGVVGGEHFSIGDTLSESPDVAFSEIPGFPPECTAYINNLKTSNHKRFEKGLNQLVQEGLVHIFELPNAVRKVPLLAAVGPLQFDLVQYRLETEYSVLSQVEKAPWTIAKWFAGDDVSLKDIYLPNGAELAIDKNGRNLALFPDEWHLRFFCDKNRDVKLVDPSDDAFFDTAG